MFYLNIYLNIHLNVCRFEVNNNNTINMKIIVSTCMFATFLHDQIFLINAGPDFIVSGGNRLDELRIRDITVSDHIIYYCGSKIRDQISCDVNISQLKALYKYLRALPEQPVIIFFEQGAKISVQDAVAEF